MADHNETLTVDGSPMRLFVSEPPDGTASPRPGVVVIMHGVGLDAFSEGMASRIAAEGYVAAAPDMYHRHPLQPGDDVMAVLGKLRDPTIVNDVDAAFDYLAARDDVDGGRIGITGFCMGGRITYLMAGSNPKLKAAAPFYGGGIRKAWGDGPSALELTQNIACPVLAFFGDKDQDPSPEHRAQIEAELKKHGKTHEIVSYPEAGHGFMAQNRPQMYNAETADDAWERLVAFFGRELKE